MKSKKPNTIIFVTGAFVGNNCWDDWQKYFQKKGFKTIAPPWPYKDDTPKKLRARKPNDTDLALLPFDKLLNSYIKTIKSLPEKPIIIGHSAGGLLTQLLINRNLGAAGVAIHPFPPFTVFPYEFSFFKAGWRALGLFTPIKETYLMSFPTWQYAFTNGMSLKVQRESYEKLVIPESKTIVRAGPTPATKIDFNKPHAPLLITSGDKDNILPASLNYRNFKRYSQTNGSITDYKEFKGRNHFVLGQKTWTEDADYILNWLDKVFKS